MMGRVRILSGAYFPPLHHGDNRVACLLGTSVWMLVCNCHHRRLEREWQELTRRSPDREGQPISVLVSSSVQPTAISLLLSASITHLHITTLQQRCNHHVTSTYFLRITITRFSLNAVPLWKWIDLMRIRTNLNPKPSLPYIPNTKGSPNGRGSNHPLTPVLLSASVNRPLPLSAQSPSGRIKVLVGRQVLLFTVDQECSTYFAITTRLQIATNTAVCKTC